MATIVGCVHSNIHATPIPNLMRLFHQVMALMNMTYCTQGLAPWYPYQLNGSNLTPFRDRIAAVIIGKFVSPSEVAQFRDQRRELYRQHQALAALDQGRFTQEVEINEVE